MTKPECSVSVCHRPAKSRGWCTAHYSRWVKTGDVDADIPIRPSPDQTKTNIPCDYCGELLHLPSWQVRSSEKHYCDNECRFAAIKRVVGICTWCGDSLNTGDMYCSVRCSVLAKMAAPKLHITETLCSLCGAVMMLRPCELKQRFCSAACHNEFQKTITGPDHFAWKEKVELICDGCGAAFQVQPCRKDRAKFCSDSCRLANPPRSSRVSSIEEIVAMVLMERGFEFDRQSRIGRFFPDFVIGKTIIEVDGDYWHNLPEVQERDVRKNEFYHANGYAVIRIWEHEVNAGDFSKLGALCA